MVYSEKVMEHFRNPRNVGMIDDADGIGEEGNPVCGDMMTFYIKVGDGRLTDVKFQTFGCGSAIAVSSMISEMAKGKTLDEALEITNKDVANELGKSRTWVSQQISTLNKAGFVKKEQIGKRITYKAFDTEESTGETTVDKPNVDNPSVNKTTADKPTPDIGSQGL